MSENYKNYKERKKERRMFSWSYNGKYERTSDLSVKYCNFYHLNRPGESIFSITELDDKTGFGIEMQNVTVVPSSCLVIYKAPKWFEWLASKLLNNVYVGR